jgi:glutamate---cysteine ligase / carboxylate-amine ligase
VTALTMGVEEEFFLVDGEGELVQEAAGTVDDADETAEHEPGASDMDLKPELLRCQVESASPVCLDHDALGAGLLDLRTRLSDAAAQRGARLLASGTAVKAPRDPQRVAEGRRYRRIVGHVGRFVVDEATCGCHVHVGVDSREVAIQVSNHLRPWLPALLALSANSPFHHGVDTGYASVRYLLWGRWPTSGPPPYLDSEEHYERIVHGLLRSGAAADRGMIYWDIRPSEHQPTVEIRVFDTTGTAAEATLHGVLVRTLVAEALERIDRRQRAEPLPHEVLQANLWRAARDGLDGYCADPATGELRPVHDILTELASRCAGGKSETDFANEQLEMLRRNGCGATRQRAALRSAGRWNDVLAMLVDQTLRPTGDAHPRSA